jgi:hypothetical protein
MNKNKFSIINEETGEELKPLTNEEVRESFKELTLFGKEAQIALNEALKTTQNLAQNFKKGMENISETIEEKTGNKPKGVDEILKAIELLGNDKNLLELPLKELLEALKKLPPIVKEAIKNYPISGHFIDVLLSDTIEEISKKIPPLALSKFEDDIVLSLLKCLYINSSKNMKDKNYYLGNGETKTAKNGNSIAQLVIKPQDLYKEITGKKRPNGKDIKEIKEALIGLSSKNYTIEYSKKVGKEFIIIRNSQPLLNISSLARLNEEENSKYIKGDEDLFTKKESFVISFNPIFSDQVDKKFILMPTDLKKKISLASPKRVKTSTNYLRDYLLRGLSSKKYSQEIYRNNLEAKLKVSHRRKNDREELLNEALEVCKKVKLLDDYSITKNSKGDKFTLKINSNFIK